MRCRRDTSQGNETCKQRVAPGCHLLVGGDLSHSLHLFFQVPSSLRLFTNLLHASQFPSHFSLQIQLFPPSNPPFFVSFSVTSRIHLTLVICFVQSRQYSHEAHRRASNEMSSPQSSKAEFMLSSTYYGGWIVYSRPFSRHGISIL